MSKCSTNTCKSLYRFLPHALQYTIYSHPNIHRCTTCYCMYRCCSWQLIGTDVFKKFSIFYGILNLITILKKPPVFPPPGPYEFSPYFFQLICLRFNKKLFFLFTPRPSYFLTSGPLKNIS